MASTYAWSQITSAQGLSFTAADTIAFDAGGNARDVVVNIGAAVTQLTYAGKTVTIQNSQLLGNPDDFLFLDGSQLGVNAAAGNAATFTLSGVNDQYQSKINSGTDTAQDGGVDNIGGGSGNDDLNGGDAGDSLQGNDGNDLIDGNQGNDNLQGGAGNDTVFGGKGNDIIGGGAPDGAGAAAGAGDDSLNGDLGNDTISGGAGNDQLRGGSNNDTIADGSGNDTAQGEDGEDTFTVGAGTDLLQGNQGNDTFNLTGNGLGTDTIFGGQGADTVNFISDGTVSGNANNQIHGDLGSDTVVGNESVSGALMIWGDEFGTAGSNDALTGGAGNDTIFGGNEVAASTALGGSGATAANGDSISGGGGADSINGNQGNDDVRGGAGNDSVFGGQGRDSLSGEGGNDSLSGDLGNDTISGGTGVDSMTGGDLGDRFVFAAGETGSATTGTTTFDTITDFRGNGLDSISLVAPTAGGYAERALGTGNFETALTEANQAFAADTVVTHLAVQVSTATGGLETYVFYAAAADNTASAVVRLTGIGIDQISSGDFV